MAETYPEQGVLWDEIRHRAHRVDLVGLRDLVARLRPTQGNEEQIREPAT
jgi:hypothetical protein